MAAQQKEEMQNKKSELKLLLEAEDSMDSESKDTASALLSKARKGTNIVLLMPHILYTYTVNQLNLTALNMSLSSCRKPTESITLSIFLPITTPNDPSFSIRAINIWLGLPDFQGRSPAGL